MTKKNTAARLGALAATVALTAAACGSDSPEAAEAEPVATEAPTGTEMGDMDEMDHMAGMMGDPTATAADDVAGAALARGEYALLESRPQGYDDTAGTAVIARHGAGTTVTTELTGLLPNVEYISHVHAEPCANDGGPHFQFEAGGAVTPPNEIHLAFTSDNDGNGFMTAENAQIAGVDAVAFVVHPREFIDNKVACVDFVEDELGSTDAVLEVGLTSEGGDPDGVHGEDHGDDHGGEHGGSEVES